MEPTINTDQKMEEQVIAVDRVARVVKGGRRFRFRALVVVGDRRGRVGLAVTKASDVASAITKAGTQARKKLLSVPITSKGSIPHQVETKFSGAHILLKPARPGTGVRASGTIRPILEAVGIRDVLSKSLGSTNKLNNCYATMKALSQLESLPDNSPKPKASSQENS